MIRIGMGYDLHRLVPGRPLILGGITIPFDKGEDGHSDGDVLLHAIADALLGAAALGDIGSFFPSSELQWKNANSKILLGEVWNRVRKEGWNIENIDSVIALEQPKFLPWREAVRASIADILDIVPDRVFVKAKTGEGCDSVGHGEAVAVWATCLLSRPE